MGHLNGILARVEGNLNNNFQKSEMPGGLPGGLPGGGMLKLQFDRYIRFVPTSHFPLLRARSAFIILVTSGATADIDLPTS